MTIYNTKILHRYEYIAYIYQHFRLYLAGIFIVAKVALKGKHVAAVNACQWDR
jgi:hypothetical protein